MAQETTAAAELAAAQAKLDAYNAATGSNLKMEQPRPAPLNLTPAKIGSAIEDIVEETFPRPRQELCIPVGEMERKLTAYVGETVQAVYNDADRETARLRAENERLRAALAVQVEETQEVAADARERLARHLYVTESPGRIMAAEDWDRNDMYRRPYYERADELLAVITGTKG